MSTSSTTGIAGSSEAGLLTSLTRRGHTSVYPDAETMHWMGQVADARGAAPDLLADTVARQSESNTRQSVADRALDPRLAFLTQAEWGVLSLDNARVSLLSAMRIESGRISGEEQTDIVVHLLHGAWLLLDSVEAPQLPPALDEVNDPRDDTMEDEGGDDADETRRGDVESGLDQQERKDDDDGFEEDGGVRSMEDPYGAGSDGGAREFR